MKLIAYITILLLIMNCSSKNETISLSKNVDKEDTYKHNFIYQQGYKQGIRDAQTKIENRNKEVLEEILEEYFEELKEYDKGKYAIEQGLVTNPKIYHTLNKDGSITMKIIGCKIAKNISIEDFTKGYTKLNTIVKSNNEAPLVNSEQNINTSKIYQIYNFDEINKHKAKTNYDCQDYKDGLICYFDSNNEKKKFDKEIKN